MTYGQSLYQALLNPAESPEVPVFKSNHQG